MGRGQDAQVGFQSGSARAGDGFRCARGGGLTDTVGTLHYALSAASNSGLRAEQDFLGQDGHLK